MSADNYLLIKKKSFEVWLMCASTNTGYKIGKGKDFIKACEIAEKYEKENLVEYGIHFS